MAITKPKPKLVITPRLRVVLFVVLSLFSILLANGAYLTTITWLQHFTGEVYENHVYQLMFLGHLGLGFILVTPVIVFGFAHWRRAKDRRNRRAVKIGYALLGVAIVVLVTGVLLSRIGPLQSVGGRTRQISYWLHLLSPLAVVWLYWLHRLVGPRIKWHVAGRVALVTAGFVGVMISFHYSDAKISEGRRPADGEKYFQPSLATTSTGNFIEVETLMNDEYCLSCHSDIHDSWIHSAHRLSSFNNPAYRASVRESREVATERTGNVQAARFCAGCHDPVPFFTGQFDDPNYDDVANPTAHAGITCTVCHAIESVDSTLGNADYTIDEPEHYPFAYSKNSILRGLNELMVKAKPAFHKKEMLKPFHKTAEFCGTCHKVNIVGEVTNYKEFLRGQNHYDTYLLSGVSGHGARSFYYPPKAQDNCNECHMPAVASDQLGSQYNEVLGRNAVHDHFFPSANSALSHWTGDEKGIEAHRKYLRNTLRIDLFGLRREGRIDGELVAPLDQAAATANANEKPIVQAGETVLLDTVLRTLTLGHHFTQGTTDSNQVWIELKIENAGETILVNGGRDERESVDPNSHFVNTFMLDREGNRISRRNVADIFTPLYSHQIPPGAGQTVHYQLQIPSAEQLKIVEGRPHAELKVTARLLYRKFDTEFLDFVRADRDPERDPLDLGQVGEPNDLPIIEIDCDSVTLQVDCGSGAKTVPPQALMDSACEEEAPFPLWQRWNDYGIGMLLKGKAELRQAAEAFRMVESLGRCDGPMNLARVQLMEGDLDSATDSLARASRMDPPPVPWTFAWLSGSVDRQQGNLERAAKSLASVLDTRIPERGFDFSLDIVVRNELALTYVDLAQRAELMGDDESAKRSMQSALNEFLTVLETDAEDVTAHANLAQVYDWLGDRENQLKHRKLHELYRPDENAVELAVPLARQKYPAADKAAEGVVIYELFPLEKFK